MQMLSAPYHQRFKVIHRKCISVNLVFQRAQNLKWKTAVIYKISVYVQLESGRKNSQVQ